MSKWNGRYIEMHMWSVWIRNFVVDYLSFVCCPSLYAIKCLVSLYAYIFSVNQWIYYVYYFVCRSLALTYPIHKQAFFPSFHFIRRIEIVVLV